MKRCFRRFSDLLEERNRAAKEHVPGLGDDDCYYTKSNKMIIHKSHCPNDHIDFDEPGRAPAHVSRRYRLSPDTLHVSVFVRCQHGKYLR